MLLVEFATIANMAPEYGATMGYFPIDENSIDYLRLTGRDEATVAACSCRRPIDKLHMGAAHEAHSGVRPGACREGREAHESSAFSGVGIRQLP